MNHKIYLIPVAILSGAIAMSAASAAPGDVNDGSTLNQAEARLGEAVTAAKNFVHSAYAELADENDAIAVEQAGITLSQAVDNAKRQTGGKASRAEFERHDGRSTFDIEIVKAGQVLDVIVDAQDGRVLQVRADDADCADDERDNDRADTNDERDD